jgi:hypothetical protein
MYYNSIKRFDHSKISDIPDLWKLSIEQEIKFLLWLLECQANPLIVDEYQLDIEDVDFEGISLQGNYDLDFGNLGNSLGEIRKYYENGNYTVVHKIFKEREISYPISYIDHGKKTK